MGESDLRFHTAALPFALPVFDLTSYIDWFGLMAGKALAVEMLPKSLRYSLLPPKCPRHVIALTRPQIAVDTAPYRLPRGRE